MKVFLSQNGFDVVIGSRYKTGINVVNWPLRRLFLSYFALKFNYYKKLILHQILNYYLLESNFSFF